MKCSSIIYRYSRIFSKDVTQKCSPFCVYLPFISCVWRRPYLPVSTVFSTTYGHAGLSKKCSESAINYYYDASYPLAGIRSLNIGYNNINKRGKSRPPNKEQMHRYMSTESGVLVYVHHASEEPWCSTFIAYVDLGSWYWMLFFICAFNVLCLVS